MPTVTSRWYRSEVSEHNRALNAPYSEAFRRHLTRPQLFRVRAEDGRIEPREEPRQPAKREG